GLAADLLFAVAVDEEGERGAIRTAGGLDDERDEVLLRGRVEVLEVLARLCLMTGQVEVAAVVDALELLPAERGAGLDVDRLPRVAGELVRGMLAEPEARLGHAVARVPAPAARQPLLEDRG